MQQRIDHIYQQASRSVFATLVRLLQDFDLAEDALQDAYLTALETWPQQGIPDKPAAWLVSTGRFKAIDQLRRRSHFNNKLLPQLAELEQDYRFEPEQELAINDDQLRLIFTCCHPALALDAQLALTLREVCGLSTEAIAKAFICKASTIAQRIVRAKNKIRDANIPYEIPQQSELPQRMTSVLKVIYLLFNEGYQASSGAEPLRKSLCQEAIRLAQLLCQLLQQPQTEALGLLALLLLQDARRDARTDDNGEIILLEQQDRTLWHQAQIADGLSLLTQALASGIAGSYTLQAAIAALHAQAPSFAATDWQQIVALYHRLYQLEPNPVIALNQAVAISMLSGPDAGPAAALALLDDLAQQLLHYHLFHAARADCLRRIDQVEAAIEAYQRALALTEQQSEIRFLERRISECRQKLTDKEKN